MQHPINVSPSQTAFDAAEDETILAAAIRQGINLPHSCQSGVCGSCAARLLSGSVRKSAEYDDYVLTEEELASGMILLCCSQAQSAVEVDMPSYAGTKAIDIRTLPARIGKVDIRGDVAVMSVALPKAPPFCFYAGQYMEILTKDGGRYYSIASSPDSKGTLEFHIRHQAGGMFSPQLFSGSLKSGSIIRLRGPLGSFTLNEESNAPLLLLATGTGLAPVKSILHRLADTASTRPVHLYFGARGRDGLYDESALQELLARLPAASYTPVLSRADSQWQGAQGYIQEQALHDYPELSAFEAYACGSPAMIREAKQRFTAAGLADKAFYSDAFTAHV